MKTTVWEPLRMAKPILEQTNSWKAWVLFVTALLWTSLLSISPIAIGILVAVQSHSFWAAVWVPILLYIIYGLFLAFWPVAALVGFIGAWQRMGFLEALLTTVLGWLLLFVLVSGPEWLMFLALRYSEKAAQFNETR